MASGAQQQSLWEDPPAADKVAGLQSAFEHQVILGLAAEWENALWLLPDSIRLCLKKPIFAIRDMGRILGRWHPDRQEITLSRDLVNTCRWDDVKEVLLHEMAHQLAGKALPASAETDHGPGFRQACRQLRANHRASGTYRPLHERLQHGDKLNGNDRMVVKIQKLMALAESNNANEAHAAMRKAYELISRHNVALIGRGGNQEFTSIFLGKPRLRHFREAYHLAHLLQTFYFVQGMWIHAWVLEKGRMGRVLEISGSHKNVVIAEYVYDAVCHYIDATWIDYRRGRGLNRYRKTDFAVGVIEGFATTLQQSIQSNADAGHLPVRVEDHALTRYMTGRYPHVHSFARKGTGHDAQVLADGTRHGKKLIIAKGICRSDGFKERVLEYKHET